MRLNKYRVSKELKCVNEVQCESSVCVYCALHSVALSTLAWTFSLYFCCSHSVDEQIDRLFGVINKYNGSLEKSTSQQQRVKKSATSIVCRCICFSGQTNSQWKLHFAFRFWTFNTKQKHTKTRFNRHTETKRCSRRTRNVWSSGTHLMLCVRQWPKVKRMNDRKKKQPKTKFMNVNFFVVAMVDE